MKEVTIDCSQIRTKDDLHRIFRETLAFPEWYGNNLDALHDCLTAISGTVRLFDWETAQQNLGPYGAKATKVMTLAAFHNTALDLYI